MPADGPNFISLDKLGGYIELRIVVMRGQAVLVGGCRGAQKAHLQEVRRCQLGEPRNCGTIMHVKMFTEPVCFVAHEGVDVSGRPSPAE